MSRRARNRRDRRVILNPVAVAIANAQRLIPVDRANLQGICLSAFEEFRRGRDCPNHWATMADALNMAESLASIGIASDIESQERIEAAQRALADVALRHGDGGSWTLHAPEMAALDDGLLVHHAQLEHCSLREYESAERMTRNRLFQARHGNAPAGAIVIDGGIGRSGDPSPPHGA
jgi:hypothetical protein